MGHTLRRPGAIARESRHYELKAHDAHARGDLDDAAKYAARAAALRAQLRDADRCSRCGRKLTDAESIARGTGPDCAQIIANEARS